MTVETPTQVAMRLSRLKGIPRYNVQCPNGHVWTAEPGSGLEQECIKLAEHYFDALCVGSEECKECQYRSDEDKDMAFDSGFFDGISSLKYEPLAPDDVFYMIGYNQAKKYY